ncbi:coproporphyrinogen III oxidase family protein [Sporolactobacillus shoreicorticis]|uniref:Heme chaperone HemW n=1 Tax=Sporolactobacillus shoreicorticis TaxID=1923877 RepID=A0ABW5S0A0_9BACL|nr:coproporphyrinogen-III oxidase family protein [Sporolactobacillus shoreicorticis]MCO7127529.1 coproporphyrinogen III oxidase family protein [Sporolactobacillus shoreicorticis]
MLNKVFNNRLDDFWVYPRLTRNKHKREFNDNFFDFLNNPRIKDTPTNLYVHIPFCDSNCFFCPYYKVFGKKGLEKYKDVYIDSIIKEMSLYGNTNYIRKKKISSIHFGGGNPFLLNVKDFEKIIQATKKFFNFKVDQNISVEGSINCITNESQLKDLYSIGVDRISFGVQTFDPKIRKNMYIRATLEELYKGIDLIKKFGKMKFCVDMMYNMPDQNEKIFLNDLKKVNEINPYQMDLYSMAVFPNTNLDKKIRERDYYTLNPSNENSIRMFIIANNWLKGQGYNQLTINTYSRYQKKVHIGDKVYLNNGNVIGLGASSRGYIDGYAYKNVVDIEAYISEVMKLNYPAELSLKCSEDEHNDRKMVLFPILLKIPKNEIPNYSRYKNKLDELVNHHILELDDESNYRVTDRGLPWTGNISSLFINKDAWDAYLQSLMISLKKGFNPYNEDYMGCKHERKEKNAL